VAYTLQNDPLCCIFLIIVILLIPEKSDKVHLCTSIINNKIAEMLAVLSAFIYHFIVSDVSIVTALLLMKSVIMLGS